MKRILILMARFGGGHEAIARAIKDAILGDGNSKIEIVIEDGFPRSFVTEYYSTLIPLLKESYQITDSQSIAKVINLSIGLIVRRHIQKIIKKYNPDLILSNYPVINTSILTILRSMKKKIPFIIFFADATYLHQLWLTEKNADLYLAPTKDCLKIAIENNIPADRLFYTGWILRKEFYEETEKNHYKKNLGFDERKNLIYLSGGGDGYGKIQEITEELLKNKFFLENCQLAIICGANHKLLTKMQKIQRKQPEHIFSFGYISNVFDFKKAADVICSKAGPNDIFESVMLEKPFFAHNYLWGHEKDNFYWVKKQNIGFAEKNPTKMVNKIISAIKKPELMDEKIENVKLIKKEHINAPKILAEEVKKLLN